ncbi:hypothetical protein F4780DRAFT_37933 [Xylariomycetidae sp. FL0641]|nr:hypothetical protein F4780DRAFT_37933 [Xylariomycetidae sp. FL0641]
MDRLPVELLHLIFASLPAAEARSLRLCCKAFAAVGACYGFREIVFFSDRNNFRKLWAICEHPVISKYVRAFIYHTVTLEGAEEDEGALQFEEYYAASQNHLSRLIVEMAEPNWLPESALGDPRASPTSSPSSSALPGQPHYSAEDIAVNYSQYLQAYRDQCQVFRKYEDYTIFNAALPRLPQLQQVVLTDLQTFDRPTCFSCPFDAFFSDLESSIYRSTHTIFHVLRNHSLPLTCLSIGMLYQQQIDPDFFDDISTFCRSLKSIDLLFFASPPQETRLLTDTGVIAAFLTSRHNLTGISIGFTNLRARYWEDGAHPPTVFHYPAVLSSIISPGFKWSGLRHVELRGIESERGQLSAFFKLHRDTLRSIVLRDCRLVDESWTRLFWWMKQNLRLTQFTLSGVMVGAVEDPVDYPLTPLVLPAPEALDFGGHPPDMDSLVNYLGSRLRGDLSAWYFDNEPFPIDSPMVNNFSF